MSDARAYQEALRRVPATHAAIEAYNAVARERWEKTHGQPAPLAAKKVKPPAPELFTEGA